MELLSTYLTPGTPSWNRIRCYVTNSTRIDLLRRIILFASDVMTLNEIHLNNPRRAAEILASRTFLTTLIGHMVHHLEDEDLHDQMEFLR